MARKSSSAGKRKGRRTKAGMKARGRAGIRVGRRKVKADVGTRAEAEA